MARGKVFIVDDDPDNLAYFSHLVTEAGYGVETHSDGSEALARMRAEPPAMVFLDVQMPHMNGFQVLKAIRESEDLAEVPVVLLSAIGAVTGEEYDAEKIESRYGVRPDAFMPKTIDPQVVQEQLSRFIKPQPAEER